MQRDRYPSDWKVISLRVREEAGWCCEWPGCGAEQGRPHPVTGSKVVLTVAHLDHDTANNARENLRAWCQMHHLRYDAKHHAKNAARTRWQKKYGGQPSLSI
jgi:hypothetical protein